MLNVRHVQKRVLGYTIERLDQYNPDGSLKATHYEVTCPYTGVAIGKTAHLRMAERLVVKHELHGLGSASERDRSQREIRAA